MLERIDTLAMHYCWCICLQGCERKSAKERIGVSFVIPSYLLTMSPINFHLHGGTFPFRLLTGKATALVTTSPMLDSRRGQAF